MKNSDDKGSGRIAVLINLAIFVLVVAILRVGHSVVLPIAIAGMIAFLLSPLVARLQRWGLGKTPAVSAATVMALIVVTLVGFIMTRQAWDVVRALPRYEQNIDAKIEKLKAPRQSGALSQVVDMISRYEKKLMSPSADLDGDKNHPVAVRVEPVSKSTLSSMSGIAAPVLEQLGVAGMVTIFVVAILLQREDLQDRFLNLVAADRVATIRAAIGDASDRVYRYLAMQLLVNTCYGIFVALGLWLIGIPSVLLWGLLSMLLRFVPFLGPWVAAAFPVTLALAIEPGWTKFVYTLGLYALAEVVTANLVEVLLYGAVAGISSLALMFAAVFWTWLWGAPGLFLSTPLTVCLMVIGNYIPALRAIHLLFERDVSHARPSRPRRLHAR